MERLDPIDRRQQEEINALHEVNTRQDEANQRQDKVDLVFCIFIGLLVFWMLTLTGATGLLLTREGRIEIRVIPPVESLAK